jgi:cbb3-type cytochrome c oxidase subunit III
VRLGRVAAGLLALVVAAAASGCGSVGRADATADTSRGKSLFAKNCGQCHRLADAGTQGRIGPDLDAAFGNARNESLPGQGIAESTIRDIVRGQIAYPVEDPTTEVPGMPANLVTGEDADAVAAYVASVAGLPVAAGGGGGGEAGGTDGKAIFAGTCGGCHTLEDAGTSGTIGPNLDESKPNRNLALERVTHGKGVMPAFKGQLSDKQIEAVADYVAENAGK